MVMPFGGRVGDGFLPPSSRGQALSGDNGGEGAYEGRPYGDAGGNREGSVIGGEIPRLGFAAFGMTMALGKPPKEMKMDSV